MTKKLAEGETNYFQTLYFRLKEMKFSDWLQLTPLFLRSLGRLPLAHLLNMVAKLHELRWDIEGTDYSEMFRQKLQVWSINRDLAISHSRKVVIGGRIILAIAIIFILLYNRLSLLSVVPVLAFSVIASIIGAGLGRGSEYLYNYNVHYSIGADIGLYCGIAAAICYSAIMLNFKFKEKHFGEFLYSSVGYGVLTGILSSSVVHVSIALAGGYKLLPNLVIGGFFGAGAGLVLGIIFAIGLTLAKSGKTEQVLQEGQND